MTASLAEDVFFCMAQGHGVFLDLKRDAYSAIPLQEADSLPCDVPALLSAVGEQHGEALRDAGLLAACGQAGGSLSDYLAIARPTGQFSGCLDRRAFGRHADTPGVPPSAIDIFEVLSACRIAAFRLRRWPIARTIKQVRGRKAHGLRMRLTPEALAGNVDMFSRIRPWYPRAYLCLFDSLALLEFLARRGAHPDWIFGVQVQPFAAHCWLQIDGKLLNETLERAGQFTPIMSV
ncbi:MAG: lasso peptide biosynthesis B2 protein [Hyphomonadaceae bacterium]